MAWHAQWIFTAVGVSWEERTPSSTSTGQLYYAEAAKAWVKSSWVVAWVGASSQHSQELIRSKVLP